MTITRGTSRNSAEVAQVHTIMTSDSSAMIYQTKHETVL